MGEKSNPGMQLSYVLPTHNRVEYLGECVLSLMEQNFPANQYELIVVDDGSTDSTPELMRFFLDEYKNIRYYQFPKQGVEASRNFGNKEAKANIIGVCDSDDIYHPDRTKITVGYFQKHPEKDLMNGSYVEINHQGGLIRKYDAKPLLKKDFYRGMGYFCHDNCAYRKSKVLATPYRFTQESTDDWNLVCDWLKKGYKFGYVKEELCRVRTLRNGIMGARRAERGVRLSYE